MHQQHIDTQISEGSLSATDSQQPPASQTVPQKVYAPSRQPLKSPSGKHWVKAQHGELHTENSSNPSSSRSPTNQSTKSLSAKLSIEKIYDPLINQKYIPLELASASVVKNSIAKKILGQALEKGLMVMKHGKLCFSCDTSYFFPSCNLSREHIAEHPSHTGRQGAPHMRVLYCDANVTKLFWSATAVTSSNTAEATRDIEQSLDPSKTIAIADIIEVRAGTDIDPETSTAALKAAAKAGVKAASTMLRRRDAGATEEEKQSAAATSKPRKSLVGSLFGGGRDKEETVLYGTSILRKRLKENEYALSLSLITADRTVDIQCLSKKDYNLLYVNLKEIVNKLRNTASIPEALAPAISDYKETISTKRSVRFQQQDAYDDPQSHSQSPFSCNVGEDEEDRPFDAPDDGSHVPSRVLYSGTKGAGSVEDDEESSAPFDAAHPMDRASAVPARDAVDYAVSPLERLALNKARSSQRNPLSPSVQQQTRSSDGSSVKLQLDFSSRTTASDGSAATPTAGGAAGALTPSSAKGASASYTVRPKQSSPNPRSISHSLSISTSSSSLDAKGATPPPPSYDESVGAGAGAGAGTSTNANAFKGPLSPAMHKTMAALTGLSISGGGDGDEGESEGESAAASAAHTDMAGGVDSTGANVGAGDGHQKPKPATPTTPDVSPYRMKAHEALQIGLILSQQEHAFGTNMYQSLTPNDEPEIERLNRLGYSTEEAILQIFQKKFQPEQFRLQRQVLFCSYRMSMMYMSLCARCLCEARLRLLLWVCS
jgi:hypothetical protein